MNYLRSFSDNYRVDEALSDSSDEDEEVWNPLEVIDAISTTEDKEDKLVLKRQLLEKFLDQKTPMVTAKMKDFFMEDGMIENLLSFLIRFNPSLSEEVAENQLPPARILVSPETEVDVKRSFRLMKLFLSPSKEFEGIVGQKLPIILKELMGIFSPQSQGNLHHWKAIFEAILGSRPHDTTKLVVSNEFFNVMASYAHETPIMDAVLTLFTTDFRSAQDSVKFYTSLNECRALDQISNKLTIKGSPLAPFIGDFFVRLTDRLASVEPAAPLFNGLARTAKIVDKLFSVITEEGYAQDQKTACASVLKELLTRGVSTPITHELQRPLPNVLAPVNERLHEYAQTHTEALCNELINIDNKAKNSPSKEVVFSSFKVEKPFGFTRLLLMELLSDMVVSTPYCLDSFPTAMWRVLSGWFLEYSYNNIYGTYFYRIVQTVFVKNHENSYKTLLKQYKFLTTIIKAYTEPSKAGARGFILQICNVIRLAAEMEQPNGWLRNYLTGHDLWRPFLPKLREETILQRRAGVEPVRKYYRTQSEEDPGIDLGSSYAKSLGFTGAAPIVVEPVVTLSTQTTAATATGAPKKKKKKKKKKSKSTDGSTSPQMNGNQHHDEEDAEESEEHAKPITTMPSSTQLASRM